MASIPILFRRYRHKKISDMSEYVQATKSIDERDIADYYVVETWKFECHQEDRSFELIQKILEEKHDDDVNDDEIARAMGGDTKYALRCIRKIRNIRAAVVGLRDQAFSVDTALRLHTVLMTGLHDSSVVGAFRTKYVKPAGSTTTTSYVAPHLIDRQLHKLFEETSRVKCETIEEAIILAAIFCERFLMIHPFINGNGRCVRLMCSILLKNWFPIPIGLQKLVGMTYAASRDEYIVALEACREIDYEAFICYFDGAIRAYLFDLLTLYA